MDKSSQLMPHVHIKDIYTGVHVLDPVLEHIRAISTNTIGAFAILCRSEHFIITH